MPFKSNLPMPKGTSALDQLMAALSIIPMTGAIKGPELGLEGEEFLSDMAGLGKKAPKAAIKKAPELLERPELVPQGGPSEGMAELLQNPPSYEGESTALGDLLRTAKRLKAKVPSQQLEELLKQIGPQTQPRDLREIHIKRQMIQHTLSRLLDLLQQKR